MSVAMHDGPDGDDGAFDDETVEAGAGQSNADGRVGNDGVDRGEVAGGPGEAGATAAGPADIAAVLEAAAAASATPDAMVALARLIPDAVPAVSLVHGILSCQRLASWADAVQQTLIAALARPGVAVPIERVVDAARWSNAKPGELWAPDRALDAAEDPITNPGCAGAVAHHAARFASLELGAALHLSPLAARVRVERALLLVDIMPQTLAAQRAGELDPLRTRILAESTAGLSDHLRSRVERAVLPAAGGETPSQLRAAITRTILRLDPDGAADRANAARKNRDVYSRPQPNDLATVSALMGADKAATMMWLLNTMADAAAGPGDSRGIGERRIDALTDIVDDLVTTGIADIRPVTGVTNPTDPRDTDPNDAADGPSSPNPTDPTGGTDRTDRSGPARCDRYRPASTRTGPPVCLTVYIAASTLAGSDDWPAELAGQGAITPNLARALARAASTARVVAVDAVDTGPPSVTARGSRDEVGSETRPRPCEHPGCTGEATCGTTLDHGRDVYRPPAKVAEHVIDRDRCCRFPGCRMPAVRCDLDHGIPFDAGGSTCACNLRPLCRLHHLAKTFTGWAYTTTDGTITWTSPLGLRYSDPQDNPTTRLVTQAENPQNTEEAKREGAVPNDDPPPF